ncbi:MAG: pentapeptide repeat-containing protein [Actinopolymorphaceae bacterium]
MIDDIKNAAAGGFEYCRTVTIDGKVVYHQASSRRYKPTAAQRRLIQAMHRTCSQPGCSRPAVQCDLDHVVEHRLGGPSCMCNLAPLCRRHHRAKHEGSWYWTQNQPGHLTAQSPLGHTYTIQPEPPPGTEPAGAELTGAELTGAELTGAELTGAELTGAEPLPGRESSTTTTQAMQNADPAPF